jgi:hypothetical protein
MKMNEGGRTYDMYGRQDRFIWVLMGRPEPNLKNLGIAGRIISK